MLTMACSCVYCGEVYQVASAQMERELYCPYCWEKARPQLLKDQPKDRPPRMARMHPPRSAGEQGGGRPGRPAGPSPIVRGVPRIEHPWAAGAFVAPVAIGFFVSFFSGQGLLMLAGFISPALACLIYQVVFLLHGIALDVRWLRDQQREQELKQAIDLLDSAASADDPRTSESRLGGAAGQEKRC